ncbi:hypothetical protein [Marinobacterium lutimaris]|uniref:Uncharacterized protein n=1 Tax=Marinobacterium lutimaris TaxID=568106 RepID=A0A1H5WUW2_9GAMM|nr:hypothetical protein [Marinobacterium lutimaris]SEG03103.1 hypothetical protein SAMN05444390_1011169 [Marinobacterium lutimaris]
MSDLRLEDDKDLVNSILIYSVIKSLMDENLILFLGLLITPSGLFSPTRSLDRKLLNYLFLENKIYKYKPIYDLVCNDESEIFQYAGSVNISLPDEVDSYTEYANFLSHKISSYNFKENSGSLMDLLVDIAVHDCLQFLEFSSDKYKLEIYTGRKTELIIREAFLYYNTGQVISLLWSSIKIILARIRVGDYKRNLSRNAVIEIFEHLLFRAKNEGWTVTRYKRPFNIPQCRISQVLFEDVLNVDDDGYGFSLGWYEQQICEKSLKV